MPAEDFRFELVARRALAVPARFAFGVPARFAFGLPARFAAGAAARLLPGVALDRAAPDFALPDRPTADLAALRPLAAEPAAGLCIERRAARFAGAGLRADLRAAAFAADPEFTPLAFRPAALGPIRDGGAVSIPRS